MSFNDLERGTGSNQGPSRASPRPGRATGGGPLPLYHAPRSTPHYTDDPIDSASPAEQVAEFKRLSDSVGTQIFKITSNTAAIGKLVKLADAKPRGAASRAKDDRDWSKGA